MPTITVHSEITGTPGHAFITFSPDNGPEVTRGYYPKGDYLMVRAARAILGDGEVRDDADTITAESRKGNLASVTYPVTQALFLRERLVAAAQPSAGL